MKTYLVLNCYQFYKVSRDVHSLLLLGVLLSINTFIIEIYNKTQSFHTETMQ